MQFNCAVRIGHTDDELLGMLKEAGCLMVSVGVESGDPEQLERLKTGVSLDMVRETVASHQGPWAPGQGALHDGGGG